MSEPDRPAVTEADTTAGAAGPPEDTRGQDIAEKNVETENGEKPLEEKEEGKCEQKEEDVKIEDATDKKGVEEKESEISKEVEEEEPVQEKVGEKENEVHKNREVAGDNVKETKEKGEEAKERVDEGEEKPEEIEEKGTRRRRGKRPNSHEIEGADEKIEKKKGRKAKEVFSSPTSFSIDRPVRERKTVERLVEALQKEPSKAILIEKGQGTPLKDIPNVVYKLSKKRPEDIRSLHLLLFGRRGKATNYKSHILQFSGFVWHENEEKQRAKVKEKLDKCIKDKLLDYCDVFDIPVSRTTMRKEDLVEKLLDFMVAPHATTDTILADKEQSAKSRKRRSVSRETAVKRSVGTPGKRSGKKRTKLEDTPKLEKSASETEDEHEDGDDGGEEDDENGLPDEQRTIKRSESEENESEHDDVEEEYTQKGKRDSKKPSKRRGSSGKASKKALTPRKSPSTASRKSLTKTSSKRFEADEDKDANEKAFPKKQRDDMTPRKKTVPPSPRVKEKRTISNKAGRGRAKSDKTAESGPTEEELRKTICGILKEVDFNTATFTDILKKLASHYKMDLTARKSSIKLMIQDELTKLAEEAEDEEDDNSDDAEHEDPESTGKRVEA